MKINKKLVFIYGLIVINENHINEFKLLYNNEMNDMIDIRKKLLKMLISIISLEKEI